MISLKTESKLGEILLKTSFFEREVENCRCFLSSISEFDPYSTFKALDQYSLGSLSISELQYILEKHHCYCTHEEAYLIINQYDSNQDYRLSIEEFFQLVLPSTNTSLKT